MRLYYDNHAVSYIANHPILHEHMKHIELIHFCAPESGR